MKYKTISLRGKNSQNESDRTITNNGEQPVTTFSANPFWQQNSVPEKVREKSKTKRKPSEVFLQHFGPKHGIKLNLR